MKHFNFRAFLDDLDQKNELFRVPVEIDTIEWFATPGELCATLAGLLELSERPGLEPIRDVLSENPGVAVDRAAFPFLGFKGGSEPGVLAFSWIAEQAGGGAVVVVGLLSDTDDLVDEVSAVLLLQAVFPLL